MMTAAKKAEARAFAYIVDEDTQVHERLAGLVGTIGLEPRGFADPGTMVRHLEPRRPGCVILDVRMPEARGLELPESLARSHPGLRVIMMAQGADVDTAVRAMRLGAFDFLQKPLASDRLLAGCQSAVAAHRAALADQGEAARLSASIARLSTRETEVLRLLALGLPTKAIAERLVITPKTVDCHRSNILRKTGASNATELTRLAVLTGLASEAGVK